MYFFKRENFYIPGHYMKFLISKEQDLDSCRFCPFNVESTCHVEGPSCSVCAEGIEVIFYEIKFKRF